LSAESLQKLGAAGDVVRGVYALPSSATPAYVH
jgi:hypothetical protein